MHRERRYKTVNTFTRKPYPTQIISYVIIITMHLSFWLCIQPYIVNDITRTIMIALFSLSSLLLIIFSIATSAIDPSDPIMIQYKNSESSFKYPNHHTVSSKPKVHASIASIVIAMFWWPLGIVKYVIGTVGSI